ncbi:deoxyguanosinetriphosphate triphosphohydrolase [Variovorax sp. PCZ-1]|uniref:deoxyguanosinetriphosphate triphosphohydrolase n=1 Tax=Variovorax sp. PCZ-1 TaxID=2835533 RepID=UPI001BD17EB7|nr:deoxyguanosinetriphosphate triphosphohydrolase [Variovorax sp. PCZ-1]MBS7808380.1 deoxyguanosinetriphosphate triphosphohydrolase [Variovorax sp. PCZ-1]
MRILQPYATQSQQMRSRRYAEKPSGASNEHRSDFQRDRDRIVHSTAFRRLVYKTQVFLNHEGDLFRTRMTHSLEVAQLSRSMARALGLDEDLVEAMALAHDLGHTPFGHAGQDALNAALRELAPGHGGFEHNLQSLRVVDSLEERYPDFDGLNLTLATREGILKHCSAKDAARLEALEPGGVAHRFIAKQQPSLEAQLVNLADEMAYNAHDIDDGIRSGLIDMEALRELALFERFHAQVCAEYPQLQGRRLLSEIIRRLLSSQIFDVIDQTRKRISEHGIASETDVRQAPPLVSFSPNLAKEVQQVKSWLFKHLYRHAQVIAKMDEAQGMVRELFSAYLQNPTFMPKAYAQQDDLPRAISDYIAGMTDRFAELSCRKLKA